MSDAEKMFKATCETSALGCWACEIREDCFDREDILHVKHLFMIAVGRGVDHARSGWKKNKK
jgi:hypothetical protein